MDSPFIANAGPTFDPKAAAETAEPTPAQQPGASVHALPDPLDLWDERRVRQLLTAKGQALHGIVGVGEQDWSYTESDLMAIAPPLTAILNRYEPTRAAAAAGDELALAIGFGGYASRSWRERQAVLRARREAEEVPVTGVAAPPGTGPEPELEHAAAQAVDGEDVGGVQWQR